MKSLIATFVGLALVYTTGSANQTATSRLFSDDDVLQFRLEAPLQKLFDAKGDEDFSVTGTVSYAGPGGETTLLARVRAATAQADQQLVVRSNRGLRDATLVVFDRTFAITAVLRLLALGVAFVGVLAALMALQLERSRELGVLRATGLTRGQLWGLVTAQSGLMGFAAGLLALPSGAVMAAVMVHVVNRRSFGWTLQMQLPAGMFVQAVAIAVVGAHLAGIYPAWRMARTEPALALREE